MMPKQILFGKEARQKLIEGINIGVDAVKPTLGPKGRKVILERKQKGEPDIVDDGATILRNISLKDPFQEQGLELIKSIALKTESTAGDGTTTSALLAQELILRGVNAIDKGANPVSLEKGIEFVTQKIVECLKEMAVEVKPDELGQLATLCAGDENIGKIVAEILNKYGKEAVITTEDSSIPGLSYEMIQGYTFESGWISPYMINQPQRLQTVIEDAYILILDRKLVMISDLLPILQNFEKETGKKQLVLIAEGIEGDALATLIVNKVQGIFLGLGINAPGFGKTRRELLEDMAIATGATVIAAEAGMKVQDIKLGMFGRAKKVIAKRESTEIIGGYGDEKEIQERVEQIKFQLETPDATEYYKKQLKDRIGKLTGTAAILKVGYDSEVETTAKKLKIDDTVSATKAALEEGIVPGGGQAFHSIVDLLSNDSDDPDTMAGYVLVVETVEAPIKQLIKNSGLSESQYLKTLKGVFDPVKVERLALQNAVSVAKVLLTSEAVIVEEPPKEK